MSGTEHLEVARRDVAVMLDRASDRGETERAERYQRMLEQLDATIQRYGRKGAA